MTDTFPWQQRVLKVWEEDNALLALNKLLSEKFSEHNF